MAVAAEFFAFDTETTGLDPAKHQIISIAMVLLGADLVPISHKLIHAFPDTQGLIDPEAVRVNGYTYDLWQARGAVTQEEMFQQIQAYLGRHRRLRQIAHNLLFDQSFLKNLFARFQKSRTRAYHDLFSFHGIDTIGIAMFTDMVLHNKLRGVYRLEKLAELYRVKHDDAHTALSDVYAMVDTLRAMRDNIRKSGGMAPPDIAKPANHLFTCLDPEKSVWVFTGGKHAGKFVLEVCEEEPSYLHFLLRFPDLSDEQEAYLKKVLAERKMRKKAAFSVEEDS